jgi:thioredoxin 1
MRDVTDETFEREVLQAGTPVVVDFWAPWCKPCSAVDPILEELEREFPAVTFTKLNIDENVGAPARFGVLSIPTAVLFDGGEARETVVGARRREHYERAWGPWLGK